MAAGALFAAWCDAGLVAEDGRAWGEGTRVGGPGPRALVAGGFGRVRAVDWGEERLVANRQGGFRVRCPATGANVVPAFNHAMTAWRAGGPRALACGCGATHDLADLDFAPDAAFARAAVEILDAEDAALTPEAEAVARATWGEAPRVILRRG